VPASHKIDRLTTVRVRILVLSLLVAVPIAAQAQVFGTVRVIVRDQQTLAVAGAEASIKAAASYTIQFRWKFNY
jgi:hypothetical protein